MRPGQSFETAEVVDNYQYRPDYPESLINKLCELVPNHKTALDLGCGPGKIARPLAQHFETIVAVDPSQNMLDKAQALHTGGATFSGAAASWKKLNWNTNLTWWLPRPVSIGWITRFCSQSS